MIGNYPAIKTSALRFAAKFGFITRDIFFDYLCPLKRSRKYSFWRKLQDEGLIVSARSFSEVYFLTTAGRKASPETAIPARSVFFVQHDIIVARIFLELSKYGLIMNAWTDYELTSNHWATYSILGTDRIEKVPDLVLDMSASHGNLRVALEVERSRKTNARYDQIALAYLDLKNVNLILFVCDSEATQGAIIQAFKNDVFVKNEKVPAVLLTEDFQQHGLEAKVKFFDRTISLKQLLVAALKLSEMPWTTVHGKSTVSAESA